MSWLSIDDLMSENRKILRVGLIGLGAHVSAISWCSRQLSDGVLPEEALTRITGLGGRPLRDLIARMNENELWHRRGDVCTAKGTKCPPFLATLQPGELYVHDYLNFQSTRAKILEKRAKDLARKTGRPVAETADDSDDDSARNPTVPLPLPLPDPGSSSEEPQNEKTRGRGRTLTEADIAELVDQFPTVDVKDQAERYLDWLRTKPKGYHRDQLAGLRNWLKRTRDEATQKARSAPTAARNGRYVDAGARAAARLGSGA